MGNISWSRWRSRFHICIHLVGAVAPSTLSAGTEIFWQNMQKPIDVCILEYGEPLILEDPGLRGRRQDNSEERVNTKRVHEQIEIVKVFCDDICGRRVISVPMEGG